MPCVTIFELDEDLRTSFLAGYDMTEHDILSRSADELRETAAAQQPVPEAFHDAWLLRREMIAVYSADTRSEYAQDKKTYDQVAARINNTYGNIVLTTTEADDGVLGLRGHRVSPFGTVTSGSRDGVTSSRNLAAEVAEEDRIVRERAGKTKP